LSLGAGMNTALKGSKFEDRVFEALERELKSEKLCVSPTYTKIFKRKGYYSKDRDSNIIVDISIEVYLPEKERPSLIWIFECKDYRGRIPVDDIEEFHAKIHLRLTVIS